MFFFFINNQGYQHFVNNVHKLKGDLVYYKDHFMPIKSNCILLSWWSNPMGSLSTWPILYAANTPVKRLRRTDIQWCEHWIMLMCVCFSVCPNNYHNAPVPYLIIHHIGTEMRTLLFQSGALGDMGQVHCEICEIVYSTFSGRVQ